MALPAGERFADMHRRVCAAVEQLARAHSAQTIVLVSHVGPIKVLLCAAMGAPLTSSFRIFLDLATNIVVDWQDMAHATVRLVNSHAHPVLQEARWIKLVEMCQLDVSRNAHHLQLRIFLEVALWILASFYPL